MYIAVIVCFAIIFFIPENAHAWGPATHLELGLTILKTYSKLPHDVASVIGRYSFDFIYGNISADIVVAKNLAEELKHCHNWRFGWKLLKKAENDSQRAFAYGYLSHLAADTVAHNRFIPEMTVKYFSSPLLRHIYWEMRFDSLADRRVWQVPKTMVRSVNKENDLLLGATLEDTLFSFKINKTIFSSMMSLQRLRRWHAMLAILSAASKWTLDKKDKERYDSLCLAAIKEVLTKKTGAKHLLNDPTGKEALQHAKVMAKKLRDMKRSGKNWKKSLDECLKNIKRNKLPAIH